MPMAPEGTESGVAAPLAGPLTVSPAADEPERPLLSLVVPTLNERENVVDFLTEVRQALDAALPAQ